MTPNESKHLKTETSQERARHLNPYTNN